MPADVRERMHPAELRLRLAEVARLQDRIGDMPDPETARGLSAHAEAMLKALPYAELEERRRQLTDSARHAGAPVESGGFLAAAAKLKQDNPQPQIMTAAAHLADSGGTRHLAESGTAEHRQMAAAAELIRTQRAAIRNGTPAASTTPPTGRTGPVRERHETPDVTKAEPVESVAFLAKAAGARPVEGVTRADIVKAVEAAYAACGIGEQLDDVAAEIARTRAHVAGQTKTTTGEPAARKMRSY